MNTKRAYPETVVEKAPDSGGSSVRVLIVDDHQVVREGLRRMLEMETGIEVVGEACDGQDAIDKAANLSPDVITMDLKMPGIDGITCTPKTSLNRRLKPAHPGTCSKTATTRKSQLPSSRSTAGSAPSRLH